MKWANQQGSKSNTIFFYLPCSYLLCEFLCVCSSSIYWGWGTSVLGHLLPHGRQRMLNSSHFLLAHISMPILFFMNLSVHFSLDTWVAPWCTSGIMSRRELVCLVRHLRQLCLSLLMFLLPWGPRWGYGHGVAQGHGFCYLITDKTGSCMKSFKSLNSQTMYELTYLF